MAQAEQKDDVGRLGHDLAQVVETITDLLKDYPPHCRSNIIKTVMLLQNIDISDG